jgi:two-component system chemotaxis response regulator CheB
MIRVLVVDDSPTARALLTEILSSDPEIQVVGEARDGIEGVALTQKLHPNVVTMDIQMPRMDGFAATKEIMITAPTPIVVATGSFRASEVAVAMQALQAGAVAVLEKPAGPGAPAFEEAAQKLLTTVKSMAHLKVVRHWRSGQAGPPPRPPLPPITPAVAGVRRRVVAMATSTGGPAALQTVLSGLPGNFPVPVLVVQHITRGFTPGLATWLNSVCPLRVKVAENGEVILPHTVYLGPDDQHLGVSGRGTVVLSGAPPVGGFRPAGTFLFESVARGFGAAMVAVILTGMGEDGVVGLRAVRQANGRILAQDEPTSVVWGMPGAAVAAGLPDTVLPLESIASRLVQLVS